MKIVSFGDRGTDAPVRMGSLESGRRPTPSVQPATAADLATERVANSRLSPRSQWINSWAVGAAPTFCSAHSQTTATRQPASSNSARFRRSRSTLASNFASQNSSRVAGVAANRHPACLCQKQPFTKHTALNRRNTKSGFPGRFRLCRPYRIPRRCSAWRSANSGFVSLPLTRAMILERVTSSTTSTMSRLPSARRVRACSGD